MGNNKGNPTSPEASGCKISL